MNELKINYFLLILNIFFLLYFSFQLLVFTDEFAIKNIGFFNHAVAGLAEIIGIIFLSLSLGMIYSMFNSMHTQIPLYLSIFLIEFILSINFWRYVITDAPGEATISIIQFNALIFSFISLTMLLLIYRIKKTRRKK